MGDRDEAWVARRLKDKLADEHLLAFADWTLPERNNAPFTMALTDNNLWFCMFQRTPSGPELAGATPVSLEKIRDVRTSDVWKGARRTTQMVVHLVGGGSELYAGKHAEVHGLVNLLCHKLSELGSRVDLNRDVSPVTPSAAGLGGEPAWAADEDPRAGDPARGGSEPSRSPRSVEDLMATLKAMTGLGNVKRDLQELIKLKEVEGNRRSRGLPISRVSHHLVFAGNPGTGKTTVARLLGQIFEAIGVLASGQLIVASRGSLVADDVGQTAHRVEEVFRQALGGVLFIHEANSLSREGDQDLFGREAIETLLKLMEDHRDQVVVIVAGYPVLVQHFLRSNPDLESRFDRTLHFDDYTDEDLVEIFLGLARQEHFTWGPDVEDKLLSVFRAQPRTESFGNARLAHNVFDQTKAQQATRLGSSATVAEATSEMLQRLQADDVLVGEVPEPVSAMGSAEPKPA